MITLSAEIKINSVGINATGISPSEKNNVSANFFEVVNSVKDYDNPFILGVSKLGDGSILTSKTNSYISAQKSDASGNFANPFFITIKSQLSSTQVVRIKFDTVNNRHPKKIQVVDPTYASVVYAEYIDDDAVFTIKELGRTEYRIKISDWNTPNCPLIISSISIIDGFEINRKNCLSIEANISDRADYTQPNYGIVSKTANISFKDFDGEAKDLIKDRFISKGSEIEIYLENTIHKKRGIITRYFIDDIDYSEENQTVDCSLTDGLTEWQDIFVEGISYDPRYQEPKTLMWYYEQLVEKVPNKSKFGFRVLDEKTQEILDNTIIPYPLLNGGSYWQQWTKLCQVGGFHLYREEGGSIVLKYANGS